MAPFGTEVHGRPSGPGAKLARENIFGEFPLWFQNSPRIHRVRDLFSSLQECLPHCKNRGQYPKKKKQKLPKLHNIQIISAARQHGKHRGEIRFIMCCCFDLLHKYFGGIIVAFYASCMQMKHNFTLQVFYCVLQAACH